MKICLLFHCLCETYSEIPEQGQELFVSLPDMQAMIEGLLSRGYQFTPVEDGNPNTVSVTFDDGYYNNVLFSQLSRSYKIPYILFVSAYYVLSGDQFPWFANGADYYGASSMDYYKKYADQKVELNQKLSPQDRPITFEELKELQKVDQIDIGCHGYYHQPLSRNHEQYLSQERDRSLAILDEQLGIRPKYFSLSNGMYTKYVMRELFKTFEKVFTIEGRPYQPGNKIVHRLSLINPNIGGPLIQQIERNVRTIKRIKRALRSVKRRFV